MGVVPSTLERRKPFKGGRRGRDGLFRQLRPHQGLRGSVQCELIHMEEPPGRPSHVIRKEKDVRCLASLTWLTSATWVLVGLRGWEGVKESTHTMMNKIAFLPTTINLCRRVHFRSRSLLRQGGHFSSAALYRVCAVR